MKPSVSSQNPSQKYFCPRIFSLRTYRIVAKYTCVHGFKNPPVWILLFIRSSFLVTLAVCYHFTLPQLFKNSNRPTFLSKLKKKEKKKKWRKDNVVSSRNLVEKKIKLPRRLTVLSVNRTGHLIITDHANRNGIDFRRYQFPTSGIINRSCSIHTVTPTPEICSILRVNIYSLSNHLRQQNLPKVEDARRFVVAIRLVERLSPTASR